MFANEIQKYFDDHDFKYEKWLFIYRHCPCKYNESCVGCSYYSLDFPDECSHSEHPLNKIKEYYKMNNMRMKSLKKWDGKDKKGLYQYPLEEIEKWNMQIDYEGNIWYTDRSGNLSLWCSASRLSAHFQRILSQLPALLQLPANNKG